MAFAHQVGGHTATILSSPLSSSTLIKPASQRELAFYQALAPSLNTSDFLGTWTPAFYGTLRLEGKVREEGGGVEKLDTAGDEEGQVEPEMLVLENLTFRFKRPNVLDIKLGTQLYDEEDASEEKKERMIEQARKYTSGETGMRLTGFQVWNALTHSYTPTPKPFGRTLLPSELPLGLARFFYPPYSSPSSAELSGSCPPPPADQTPPPPLPKDLLLPVLRTLVRRLEKLEEVWKTLEIRMRGGSLLIVVEGDAEALEAALLRAQAAQTQTSPSSDPSPEEAEDDSDSDASSLDSNGDPRPSSLLAFDARLIDFAHTRAVRRDWGEEGPDEGVLRGLGKVRELVEGLVGRLEGEEEEEE
ncbi:hypothetical protein JCM8547_008200 [Rhodosporidiobolus lusitaniae]